MTNELLRLHVSIALDDCGFSYAVAGGPLARPGYIITELRETEAVVVSCHGIKDKQWFSDQLETCLVKAGYTVARPFSEPSALHVSKRK